MMTARVLHIIPSLGAGGAERQLSLLAPAMVKARAQVAVAYSNGGINLARLQGCGIDLFPLPRRSHHDPRIVADLRRVIARWQPDVVETWNPQMDVLGGLAARWAGVPYVLSERSSAGLYVDHWKTRLRRHIGLRARAVIANSQGGIDYWRKAGFAGTTHLIRNGISPAVCTPPAEDLGLGGKPLLLAVGRLSREKNVTVLIDAFDHALQQLPEHHALILGDGSLRGEASARIRASRCSKRIHLGGVSPEVGYWLARADVFVSASHFEGHPNAVIEAAAAACPLVLSDIDAHREVVDESGALFAPADDALALGSCLLQAATDRPAAASRAACAKRAVSGLSIEAAAARYIEAYAGLSKP